RSSSRPHPDPQPFPTRRSSDLYCPTRATFSSSFSSSRTSRYSRATRQAKGPPPKVVPCCPTEIADANSSLARNAPSGRPAAIGRSEEHTSELQSRGHLVCRLLL